MHSFYIVQATIKIHLPYVLMCGNVRVQVFWFLS